MAALPARLERQPRRRLPRPRAASDEVMERARAAAADFTGGEPEGIAFGANMTTLNFQLAHAVARTLSPGDEIVVTALDHDANVSPWLLVAGRPRPGGADGAAPGGRRDARPRRARGADRRAHAGGGVHARLERGRLDPGRRADRRGRAPRGRARVGGRRAPGSAPARCARARLGLDVVLCSPYKFFGPHLGHRRDPAGPGRVAAGRPRAAGRRRTRPGTASRPGTQSHEAVAGATAAIDYLR